jgi:pimeloyl-ACP methyl ester carboxylesterase
MSRPRFLPTALILVAAGWPCSLNAVRAADPEPKPIVYLVDGIGGISLLIPSAKIAFPLAGVHYEQREFYWQHGKGRLLRDLQDEHHLLNKSAELAQEIRQLRQCEPNRRVYLIGHSAGTAVAVHAAEQLPPASIERIILLSSALSPTYDLTGALRATRREIVAYNSSCDCVLDYFTCLFGTADRVYGPSAGLNGFVRPPCLDDEGKRCYERLVQIPWTIDKVFHLQGGLHHSTTMPLFLARRVAPWLKDETPPCSGKAD